ncbi:MAG: hypothetical protein M0006_15610 [Magnetospirillum sp.]|nr:hypothetical protein [Magnetospirillum sp.]
MLKMTNIPDAVFLVALDHMGQERPDNPADARDVLLSAEGRCDYDPPVVKQGPTVHGTLTAFGLALAQYVSLSGPFNEDDGEFAGINGYEV